MSISTGLMTAGAAAVAAIGLVFGVAPLVENTLTPAPVEITCTGLQFDYAARQINMTCNQEVPAFPLAAPLPVEAPASVAIEISPAAPAAPLQLPAAPVPDSF